MSERVLRLVRELELAIGRIRVSNRACVRSSGVGGRTEEEREGTCALATSGGGLNAIAVGRRWG